MAEKRMSIAEHLSELRERLVICIVAALLGMIVAYVYCPDVFYPMIRAPLDVIQGTESDNPFVLRTPLLDLLAKRSAEKAHPEPGDIRPPASQLHYLSLTAPFIMRLKVSMIAGIILAFPVIVYEMWAFVSAGLLERERRYVYLCGPASFFLFLVGAALAYFVVLPIGVSFLLEQGEVFGLRAVLTINEYIPFVMWLLLGFGIIFQTPLVILFLTKLGLVGPTGLAKARRYAILGMFIVAAVITPPDPFTQIAMALPMMSLYELSIVLSRIVVRRRNAA